MEFFLEIGSPPILIGSPPNEETGLDALVFSLFGI
jgi:hypothetical protein